MATSPDRLVADLVGDRYEITGLIASGGMGSVYRARDTVLDRTVALKVLRTGTETQDFVARFRTEATNAARLSHPNIVQVYDFGYANGTPYMAMEFVDGQTLRDVLQTKRVLRPDIASRIASAVAAALEHARRAGIVHRDIKPENILITTEGQVKVADFGLSHALAEAHATQTGMLLGTAHYLAPEQVAGGRVDHRTDLYALGIVLYEMLAGRPPFQGDTPVVIAYKRVNEDVPSVNAINPGAPRELDAIIARASARDPAERYASAAAMLDDLREASPRSDTEDLGGLVHHTMALPLQGQDTVVVHRGSRTTSRRRRRRVVLIGTGLALMALTLFITGPLARASVPQVAARTAADATRILTERGFDVDEVPENSTTVPEGIVISQEPLPGARVGRGSVVKIHVSIGPKFIGMPSLKGELFADAERDLRALGFEVRRVDVFHPTVPRLHVVRQQHPAGTVVKQGSTVTLHVSKGPEMVDVPNVVGDPVESATTDLETAAFKVAIVEQRHATITRGLVISQRPKPSKKLAKGSTVTLTVSLGPPLVEVPRVICMTKRQAEDTLKAKGFNAAFEGSHNRVVDQSPGPRASAPRGSTVTLILGYGSTC